MTDAAEIARALKGRSAGRLKWVCRCPAHEDRTPSLSISVGKTQPVVFNCFAGCSPDQVIAALQARSLWNGASRPRLHVVHVRRDEDADRINFARSIWNTGTDPRGTEAEAYLASRSLFLPPELSGTVLRFHPACPWEGGTVPCLIAAFRDVTGNAVTGIHRIRLDQPGRWPKAERKMLGLVAGSAVKLDPVGLALVIGEGIETCMAARQLGFSPVWAVGSAGAIEKFGPVEGVNTLTILGENDNGANRRAAAECCRKWQPRSVNLFAPPGGFKDLNDVVMQKEQEEC